ncbi:uncharacterized protein MEPE_04857 [Melanopsichium pennsylvanicum]|uniref:Uncharacterized protein n=2 Tax=Melanopsichium pennsylvanicum TaxID=63383 RepID=A0AAJ4XPW4_9BASI|nr:putative protein [Melanopsichium pennsylvanicum 4]SNX86148.1 uncharacterized protein MEPE_04857 [Melanopsichium pennsylvanicum]
MAVQLNIAAMDTQSPRPQQAHNTSASASSSAASNQILPGSSSQPRFISANPFRRSSSSFTSGGVLARLTSSSSIRAAHTNAQPSTTPTQHSAEQSARETRRPSIGRRISSRASRKSNEAQTGANLEELSKPKGKFKSGIKWNSQQAPEPFMEASDTTAAERELAATLHVHAALASGSTAAAQAHAQNRGIGHPIFQHRTSSSATSPSTSPKVSPSQLPTVSQTISALGSSGIHPEIFGSNASSTMQQEPASSPTSNVANNESSEHQHGTMSGDGATPCMTPPGKSSQASQSEQSGPINDNHMVARAAQLVLEAARQQARVETRKKGKSAPASPKRIGPSLSPITTNDNDNTATEEHGEKSKEAHSELSRTASQRARSKSDAGGETQVKRRKSFLRAMGAKTRRSKDASNASGSGSETPVPDPSSPTIGSGTSSGTATPGGRRRRYVDTRDLDLLARELAAEAIAEQIPQPPFARASRSGTSSPHRTKAGSGGFNDPRRRSFPSILEDSPLQGDSITPNPAAARGLKPMTPLTASPPNAHARDADGRSMASIGAAKATPVSPSDPTNGSVPKEMLLGLGGSPYPSFHPPASRSTGMGLDAMDPFGIPLTQESSPFDATMAYANKTHVYHTPNQVAVSRSLSGASTWSASQTSPNNKRRPVLTMTMNDPQAELQGLTKPHKESAKRLTPFGSRASSRAPSPSPSFTNLKQVAAAQTVSGEEASVVANGEAKPDASADRKTDLSHITKEDVARPEDAASRRNSMAPSEVSMRPSLAPTKSSRMNRLSTLFRSNKSRTQVDTASNLQANSNLASSTTSPHLSVNATCSAESPAPALSPQSAAVSANSDADVSPVPFRAVDLPPTLDTAAHRSKSSSASASRRSSMALDSVARPTQGKRPIRALLRRLSSFSSSKNDKKANNAKANFPDASTMPVVNMDKLKQLSKTADEKADAPLLDPTDSKGALHTADLAPAQELKSGLAPVIQGLNLSDASPAPVNEEMAKNGFGTRSAYKLDPTISRESKADTQPVNAAEEKASEIEAINTEDEQFNGMEGGWDRSRPAQILRADSHTPSSEDSFILGSGPSTMSHPGSGALMKHGSESAISEELNTPDPSTTHLPSGNKDAGGMMMDDDALSSTVSSSVTTAAAIAAAAASASARKVVIGLAPGEGEEGAKVTAAPSDEVVQAVF